VVVSAIYWEVSVRNFIQVRLHLTFYCIMSREFIFTRESSCCFRRVLAVAILFVRPSVCLSVRRTGGSVKYGAR